MGNKPEARFAFIQERAAFATATDIVVVLKYALDVPGPGMDLYTLERREGGPQQMAFY